MLLSYSVLLGHSFIPHNHHQGSINISLQNTCKVLDSDNHHECNCDENTCIAFNELVFLKNNTSETKDKILIITFFLDPLFKVAPEPDFQAEKFCHVPLKIVYASYNLIGFISLRGPPV